MTMIAVPFQRLPAAAALLTAAALLATPAAAFDEEQLQSIPGMGAAVPNVGSNVEGGSVFANYLDARHNGQFFLVINRQSRYEKPSTDAVEPHHVHWCSNLIFTEFENGDQLLGYTGRCVIVWLSDHSVNAAAGAQLSTQTQVFGRSSNTDGISFVYVPQTNVFEGTLFRHNDNLVFRLWDDGRPVTSLNGWEVHDEGDTHPNANTSSFSAIGEAEWISANDAAALLNLNVTELTPDTFNTIYDEVWSNNNR